MEPVSGVPILVPPKQYIRPPRLAEPILTAACGMTGSPVVQLFVSALKATIVASGAWPVPACPPAKYSLFPALSSQPARRGEGRAVSVLQALLAGLKLSVSV